MREHRIGWASPALALALMIAACPLAVAGTPAPLQVARKPAAARLVDRGIQLYYEGRYSNAMKSLEKALVKGDLDATRKLGALQYLGFCQVALGDAVAARQTFERLLLAKPDFRLPAGTAPKITAIFDAVRASLAPPPPPEPPEIEHRPPERVEAGRAIELVARVERLPEDGQLQALFRQSPAATYGRLRLEPRPDGSFRGTLPAPLTDSAREVTYYLVAAGADGQRLAALGSKAEPFRLTLPEPPPTPPPPSEDEGVSIHWWIWPVVGAVALGAGLAIGLTVANAEDPTGTARVRIDIRPGD